MVTSAEPQVPFPDRPDLLVHRAVAATPSPADLAGLSPVERRRHDRLVRPEDRARFATGRMLARRVLGELLGVDPSAVPLEVRPTVGSTAPERGGTGRPVVLGPAAPRLSIAHAGDVVLVAVDPMPPADADGLGLGVDVEVGREPGLVDGDGPGAGEPGVRWNGVGRSAVGGLGADDGHQDAWAVAATVAEQAGLRALPSEERSGAFLALWTRKEAVLKASGRGLTVPMTALTLCGGSPPRVVLADPPLPPAPATRVADLDVPEGYRAAVALVELGGGTARCCQCADTPAERRAQRTGVW